jgi:hypothetical protein
MKKHLDLVLLLLFGISLFSEIMVAIYLLVIGFPLLVAAKYSVLVGVAVISLAVLKFLKRRLGDKLKEEG